MLGNRNEAISRSHDTWKAMAKQAESCPLLHTRILRADPRGIIVLIPKAFCNNMYVEDGEASLAFYMLLRQMRFTWGA
jgi:hypothetical protein